MKTCIYALALCSFLAGCQTYSSDIKTLPKELVLQQDLLERCKPVPALEAKPYTQKESYEYTKKLIFMYYDCASKHAALSEILKSYQ